MTPLPPQQPNRPEKRRPGAMPIPPGGSGSRQQGKQGGQQLPQQQGQQGQQGQRRRSSSAMPIPPGGPKRQAPRQPQQPQEEETRYGDGPESGAEQYDDPQYERIEGEDAEFETVSYDEQSRLDEEYEAQSEAEQINYDAAEYEFDDEQQRPAPQRSQRTSRERPPARKRRPEGEQPQGDRKRGPRSKKPEKRATRADAKLAAFNEPGPKDDPRPNFVDEKNMELEPYGRKKGDKAYISDVDRRANLRKKATYVQFGVIGLLMLTVGFGFKNAVFPPPTLDENEVAEIVATQTGDTGFPSERGQGFATDFMSAWAQRDDSPIRQAALTYFYGGEETTDAETILELGEFRQDIVYGPTIYEVTPVSQRSENYVIGVGVSVSDTMTGVPLEIGEGEPNIQWRFFSVAVSWDEETDAMSIAPGSPSLVPPYEIGARSEVPPATMPGSGVEDSALTEASRTTVEGFMSGYATASEENTSPIDQYITEDVEPDPIYLTQGMDGEFELDGEASEAIEHTVYRIDPDDESYVAALVNVRWRDTSAGEEDTGVVYQSTYNMRLMQEAEGRWTITGFWPLYYVPDEE